jgi:hypothetical protein
MLSININRFTDWVVTGIALKGINWDDKNINT